MTPHPFEDVPDADRLEQTRLVVDSDDIDDFSSIEPGSWDTPYTDRIEQAIEVPLDDGYEVLPH